MDIDKFFQSKAFKGFIFGVAIFLLILLIFKVGMAPNKVYLAPMIGPFAMPFDRMCFPAFPVR